MRKESIHFDYIQCQNKDDHYNVVKLALFKKHTHANHGARIYIKPGLFFNLVLDQCWQTHRGHTHRSQIQRHFRISDRADQNGHRNINKIIAL